MINIIIPFPVFKPLHLCVSFSNSCSSDVITGISYSQKTFQQSSSEADNLIFTKKIKYELESYFNNPGFQFSLPCDIQLGTPFQQRVWQALTEIPSGKVKTYGELAKELKSSARAVGNACRRNLFPVIIPCHRVVSASGVGGYAGDTLDTQRGQINFLQIKQWLLAHEAVDR